MNWQGNWVAFYTIVRREMVRVIRIWPQTLLPPIITMSLYFVIFGNVIGSRIGQMAGYDYMQYIVPGLIMMSIMTNSYTNVVSSFFGAKFQKNIEEMLVSPIANSVILWGFLMGGVLRGIIAGVLVAGIAMFFTDVHVHNWLVTILVALLTSILFSIAGFLNGLFAKKFDDISIIPTFVLTPLTYLGGIFYSVSILPAFWQKITLGNPLFYMVDAFRYGMLGVSDIGAVSAIIVISGFTIGLYCFSLWLLGRGTGLRS